MADKKITALPVNPAPLATDIVPIVHDPAGTKVNQAVEIQNLVAGIAAGATGATGPVGPQGATGAGVTGATGPT